VIKLSQEKSKQEKRIIKGIKIKQVHGVRERGREKGGHTQIKTKPNWFQLFIVQPPCSLSCTDR